MDIILGLCITFVLGIVIGYNAHKYRRFKEAVIGALHIVKLNEDDETYMFLELDKSTSEVASKKYATFKVTQK